MNVREMNETLCLMKLALGVALLFLGIGALSTQSVAQSATPTLGHTRHELPARGGRFFLQSTGLKATATATGQWTITSSMWYLGKYTVSDDGGNYSYGSGDPPSITSTVGSGDTTTYREGTITVIQQFLVAPFVGTVPDLDYTRTVTAQATIFGYSSTLHAHAMATMPLPQQNEVEVTANDQKTESTDVTVQGRTTWQDTAVVEADAHL